jgi:hypothetical protein
MSVTEQIIELIEREVKPLMAERERIAAGEQKAIEYSIKLQRLIENLKYDTDPPYPELHHHKMIVAAKAYRTALSGMIGLVQLLSRNEDIPPAIRARMTENHRFKDAQACFPEINWDEYGLPSYDEKAEDQLEVALDHAFPVQRQGEGSK